MLEARKILRYEVLPQFHIHHIHSSEISSHNRIHYIPQVDAVEKRERQKPRPSEAPVDVRNTIIIFTLVTKYFLLSLFPYITGTLMAGKEVHGNCTELVCHVLRGWATAVSSRPMERKDYKMRGPRHHHSSKYQEFKQPKVSTTTKQPYVFFQVFLRRRRALWNGQRLQRRR